MGKKHKDKSEYKNKTEYKNEYKKNILLVLSITFLISILFVCPVFGFEQSTLEQMQIDEFDKNFGFLKTSIPTLHSEKIYVKINEDGSADIVSFRKCTMTKGTENFIPINNLGKSKISNFTVSEYGKVYEKMDYWDINASMSEKAYRSGVVITDSGYELCWGISEYGDHNYKISYHVSDFVKETKDSQIIFWRFINDKTNIPPETATVVIEAPWDFDFKDSRIWAFGYEGTIDFVDGKIVAKSSETFLDRSYLTVLADFPKLTNTNDILEKTTEEIIKGAFVGSDYVYNAAVISNVDVNVTLHNDLTASFKQKYNIILDYGRNISVPLIIKNESDVKNIEVYEKFGETTQIIPHELTHIKDDRYDIVFKAEEGINEYEINYEVQNIIKDSKDSQFAEFYFCKPEELTIRKVAADINYRDLEGASMLDMKVFTNADVYYKYHSYLIRNKEVVRKHEPENTMYVLLAFPKNTFESGFEEDKNAHDIYEKRVKELSREGMSTFELIILYVEEFIEFLGILIEWGVIVILLGVTFVVVPIIFVYDFIKALIIRNRRKKYEMSHIIKACVGKYVREVPYKGEITDVYHLLTNTSDFADFSSYVAYCFLKWIDEGLIVPEASFEKGIFRTEEVINFKLTDKGDEFENYITNPHEKGLFKIISSVQKSGIIYKSDIENIGKSKYEQLGAFLKKIEADTKEVSKDLKHIQCEYIYKKWGPYEIPSPLGEKILNDTQMFKNYLLDFSLLSERDEKAVYMWGEYMAWAAFLRIADKVLLEMKVTDVAEKPYYINDLEVRDIIIISSVSRSIRDSYNAEYSSRNSSSSSGGGGSSSSGGGGGSFGGGSGGGYR